PVPDVAIADDPGALGRRERPVEQLDLVDRGVDVGAAAPLAADPERHSVVAVPVRRGALLEHAVDVERERAAVELSDEVVPPVRLRDLDAVYEPPAAAGVRPRREAAALEADREVVAVAHPARDGPAVALHGVEVDPRGDAEPVLVELRHDVAGVEAAA